MNLVAGLGSWLQDAITRNRSVFQLHMLHPYQEISVKWSQLLDQKETVYGLLPIDQGSCGHYIGIYTVLVKI
jgi:hypothetical protein